MQEQQARALATKVKAATEWKPKEEPDVLLERLSKERFQRQPTSVRKCCQACIFLNPNDTCENFLPPKHHSKRGPGEWIPIPRQLQGSICCDAWIEVELAKLLLMGSMPGGIAYSRRHPRIEIPPDGSKDFSKYFASLPRAEHPRKSQLFGRVEKETKWPEMDAGLKEILMAVERRGNEEMWSQYQGTLFMMGPVFYVNSILDRLIQKPDSPIKDFLYYVVDTHGYHYKAMFGMAGAKGAETFERIVKLLSDQSKILHDTAMKLLLAISKNSPIQPPINSDDPDLWREWAKKEFQFSWKPNR